MNVNVNVNMELAARRLGPGPWAGLVSGRASLGLHYGLGVGESVHDSLPAAQLHGL